MSKDDAKLISAVSVLKRLFFLFLLVCLSFMLYMVWPHRQYSTVLPIQYLECGDRLWIFIECRTYESRSQLASPNRALVGSKQFAIQYTTANRWQIWELDHMLSFMPQASTAYCSNGSVIARDFDDQWFELTATGFTKIPSPEGSAWITQRSSEEDGDGKVLRSIEEGSTIQFEGQSIELKLSNREAEFTDQHNNSLHVFSDGRWFGGSR
jgi:hypothetical protein